MKMKEIIVTKENFEEEVVNSSLPVIVDFFATWCGPCRMLAPVIEEIACERDDIKVCKIDVDEQEELAIRFGISTIPTVLIFKDGKVVNQSVGFRSKAQLLAMI